MRGNETKIILTIGITSAIFNVRLNKYTFSTASSIQDNFKIEIRECSETDMLICYKSNIFQSIYQLVNHITIYNLALSKFKLLK